MMMKFSAVLKRTSLSNFPCAKSTNMTFATLTKLSWADPLLLKEQLTDEERMIQVKSIDAEQALISSVGISPSICKPKLVDPCYQS
jgi:hypothetical protein